MSIPHNLQSIGQIAHTVSAEPDVDRALKNLIKALVYFFTVDHGAVYRLDLDRSQYVSQVEYLRKTDEFISRLPGLALPISDPANKNDATLSAFNKVVSTHTIVLAPSDSVEQRSSLSEQMSVTLLVPILRGQTCLGILRMESVDAHFADSIDGDDIECARSLILSLFERQSSLWLLRAAQRPIDFRQSLEDLLDDILLLAAEAARMPFIQIHEWDEDEQCLRCIAVYGPDAEGARGFDIEAVNAFSSFSTVLKNSITVVEPGIDLRDLAIMREMKELGNLRSFVIVPVRVGTQIFGTVLFGAYCPFGYSPLEVAGFESIANSIGTTITNSRNAHQLREISIADVHIGLAISGLEVAQAARHEARGVVDDCMANLATVHTYLKKGDLAEVEKLIERFGERLSRIDITLNRIKEASRTPHEWLESASLTEVWKQARGLVASKLDHEHIATRITCMGREKDVQIEVFPDSLRHAFLHLLLNSIDAFRTRRKSDRLVMISIDPQTEASLDIRIRYTDNATGIDPTEFRHWIVADSSKDFKSLIFDKGVSTKASGSGYGLYLVRMILARHHGSIELMDYRGGIVFDITLPKNLRAKVERREGKTII